MSLPPAPSPPARRLALGLAALVAAGPLAARPSLLPPPPDTLRVAAPAHAAPHPLAGLGLREAAPGPQPGPAPTWTRTTAAADSGIRIRALFTPTALYSSSRGFGIGGGIEVLGLTAPDSRWRIEARVSERFQGVQTAYFTGDPYARQLFGMLAGAATTTTRHPYYGVGPRAVRDAKVYLDLFSAESEARAGYYPLGHTGLLLQPNVRFRYDRLRGFEGVSDAGPDSALGLMDDASRAQLFDLEGDDRFGLSLGLELASDTRDRRGSPSRGYLVQGGVSRFLAMDGSGLAFNRVEASAYGFAPAPIRLGFLPERGAIFARASFVMTREDEGDFLPYFYQPVLDYELLAGFPPSRFVGRDGFSVGIGARGMIFQALGAVLVEGMSMLMVGNAYDNIFEQFTPSVTFDTGPAPAGERVPLRPSLAVGLNFVTIDRPYLGVMLGASPEGYVLGTFRIVYEIRDYRPQVR